MSETQTADESAVTRCDFKIWTPPFCQKLRKIYLVLFCISMSMTFQGAVVMVSLNITKKTLERRFGLTEAESGAISIFYEVGMVLVIASVSYMGSYRHRLRMVALGMFLTGFASILYTFPHFLADYYNVSVTHLYPICLPYRNITTKAEVCRNSKLRALTNYKYCFWLASFLIGVGATPLYTVGISYLDDNAEPHQFSANLAIAFGIANIGRAGSICTQNIFMRMNTDITRPNPGIKEESPFWVGAWWINLLISGFLALVIAVPLYAFPKQLPDAENLHFQQQSTSSEKSFRLSFMDHCNVIMSNPTFLTISLSAALEYAIFLILITSSTTYFTNNFGMQAKQAKLIVGMVCLPGAAAVMIIHGFIIKFLKLTTNHILKFQFIIAIVSLPFTGCFMLTCDKEDAALRWAGVDQPYINDSSVASLHHDCNRRCSCLQLKTHFLPLCSSNQITYFSPCFAGCNRKTDTGFSDCSCVPFPVGDLRNQSQFKLGRCTKTCPNAVLFTAMFTILFLLSISLQIPFTVSTLRCIPFEEKSFALGIQWVFIRLVGLVSGHMVFRRIISYTCLFSKESCTGGGICLSFDPAKLRDRFLMFTFIGKGLSALSLFVAMVVYREVVNSSSSFLSSSAYTSSLSEDQLDDQFDGT